MDPDGSDARRERHERFRRTKRLLRFVPRRAVFHRYPIVGRFAEAARRRGYLWSFKPEHVRPALYFGSVLALWPVLGLQLPVALALSVALRANLMVAGVLQLITNPLSAAFVYYLTYQVGKTVLRSLGWGAAEAGDSAAPLPDEATAVELAPAQPLPDDATWAGGFGSVLAAFLVGGTVCGLVLAVVLDVIYRTGLAYRLRQRPQEPADS